MKTTTCLYDWGLIYRAVNCWLQKGFIGRHYRSLNLICGTCCEHLGCDRLLRSDKETSTVIPTVIPTPFLIPKAKHFNVKIESSTMFLDAPSPSSLEEHCRENHGKGHTICKDTSNRGGLGETHLDKFVFLLPLALIFP